MRNKCILKKYLIRTFSMVLCIIISGMIVVVPSAKAHAELSAYLSDEVVENFMELFCDLGGEYADEVKVFLEGGQDPTLEVVENIFGTCADVIGVADKVSFVEEASKLGFSDYSIAYNMVEGLMSVVENGMEYCLTSNPAKKVVSGLQMIEGTMNAVGLGGYFPASFSLVLKVCDATFNIAGYLETQCFKQAVELYEGDLLLAYYTDDEFPEPPHRTTDGFGLSASEVNSIYMHLYLHYNLKRLLDKANRTVVGGTNGANAGNTGNSTTGGIVFEKMYYSMAMNQTYYFSSKYYSSSAQTDISISYSSSDTSIFTATSSGEVKPVGEGTARLIATASNGVKATCNITVYPYTIAENGTGYTISNYVGSGGTIVIPSEIDGKSVTVIGDSTFQGCNDITTVTIPDSVRTIDEDAFYGSGLISVSIPDSVTSINLSAFGGCSNLKSVHISNLSAWCEIDFENWEANPLYWADILYLNGEIITNLVIPNDVTSISDYAFCFRGNTDESLLSVTISDSVTDIGYEAFRGCQKLKTVIIGNNVTDIGVGAFSYCSSLSSVTISSSVSVLSNDVFLGCSNLTSITIPSSVTSIGKNVFAGCTNLSSVILSEGVTKIGNGAFSGCVALESVVLPSTLIELGDSQPNGRHWGVFAKCVNLKEITIPENVTVIGHRAFYGCTGLTSISIPASVQRIESHAFYSCTNLHSITFSGGELSIGSLPFVGCSNLSSVHINDIRKWCGIEFEGSSSNPLCYGSDLYINGELTTDIVIPDDVTNIGMCAFSGYTKLMSITIPDSVKNIGGGAFSDCVGLTSIIIPDGVTSIEWSTFQDCTNLTSVTIPNSVTNIGQSAFNGCSNLRSIIIPHSVTSISGWVFQDCLSLESITIPDNVTIIDSSIFSGCTSLSSITIPASVTTIEGYAFSGCDELKYVFYTGSESDWANITIGNENTQLTNAAIHYNATDHTYSTEWTIDVAATCTEEGSKSHHCTGCEKKIDVTVVEATGHSYEIDDVEFYHPHTNTYSCLNCGNKKTETLFVNDCIKCIYGEDTPIKEIGDTVIDFDNLIVRTCVESIDDIEVLLGITETTNIEVKASCVYGNLELYGTGTIITVFDGNEHIGDFTLIVEGDTNGDSVCDALDAWQVGLASNGHETLYGAYAMAADSNSDDVVDISDYQSIVNKAVS